MEKIKLPKKISVIERGAFRRCKALKYINIPQSVNEIKSSAFYECSGLLAVTLNNPDTVICTQNVILSPGGPHSPGSYDPPSFESCPELLAIYGYPGSTAQSFAGSQGKTFLPIITVKLNNKTLDFDEPTYIINDRTMVSMRNIFEELGASVEWDGETQSISAVKNDVNVKMQINCNKIYKNGQEIIIDVPPMLISDRTMVPVRAVSECLNATVDWDDENMTVIISY